MSVAGDVEEVGEGDLVFIPPATHTAIVNDGPETLVYVSAASPPVSMAELYSAELAPDVAGYVETTSRRWTLFPHTRVDPVRARRPTFG